ncbi:MAG TPA: hypothetical protein DC053_01000 [Lachnoclostridium sp.]|nr:hypothetical protein [Lachnoclostridium sp.]
MNYKINKSNCALTRYTFSKTIKSNNDEVTEMCSHTADINEFVTLSGWFNTPGNATGVRRVDIVVNGLSIFLSGTPAGQNLVGFSLSTYLPAGKKIQIRGTQTSGGDLTAYAYVHSNVAFVAS